MKQVFSYKLSVGQISETDHRSDGDGNYVDNQHGVKTLKVSLRCTDQIAEPDECFDDSHQEVVFLLSLIDGGIMCNILLYDRPTMDIFAF